MSEYNKYEEKYIDIPENKWKDFIAWTDSHAVKWSEPDAESQDTIVNEREEELRRKENKLEKDMKVFKKDKEKLEVERKKIMDERAEIIKDRNEIEAMRKEIKDMKDAIEREAFNKSELRELMG